MRIVDLSHNMTPDSHPKYRLHIKQYSVDEYLPEYKVREGQWYVMQDIEICSHMGTHVEAPYHAIKGGTTANELDMKRLIGIADIVDCTDKGYNDPITPEEMAVRGAHIEEGDIVLIKTGLSKYFGTEKYKRPYLTTKTIKWLVDKKIKCLGVDCSGMEDRLSGDNSRNHLLLFTNGIPLIEDLNNLDKLQNNKVFFIATTMRIRGIDASPLRPVAIDDPAIAKILAGKLAEVDWVCFSSKDE